MAYVTLEYYLKAGRIPPDPESKRKAVPGLNYLAGIRENL